MGTKFMSKLKIGYWPLSKNLNSPGDRRRLIFWANARGHKVETNLDKKVDLIIASENSDFNSPYFSRFEIPVIFDLIDAYLSPLNISDDLGRGLAKKVTGQITGEIKPYSHHVRDFCIRANAVICSSIEQQALIEPYNKNSHVILDSHKEISFVEPRNDKRFSRNESRILWEGQPATIRGVKNIAPVLTQLAKEKKFTLDFVTDENYYKYLNRYFSKSTQTLLKRDLHQIEDRIKLTPWTSNNLVECAKRSDMAMIPIDLSIPMQRLKPENRLLIMWRLGLPCLTSASPAYVRVASQAGVSTACHSNHEWLANFNRYLEDPGFAHREVLLGQNYLRENHSEATLLKKWDSVIESVME
jgi:hypothetical protein